MHPWAPMIGKGDPKRLKKEPKVTKMTHQVPLKAQNGGSKGLDWVAKGPKIVKACAQI